MTCPDCGASTMICQACGETIPITDLSDPCHIGKHGCVTRSYPIGGPYKPYTSCEICPAE